MTTATASDAFLAVDALAPTYGTAQEWIRRFAHGWEAPGERLDQLLALLDANVILRAPTRPPMTVGRDAGRKAFERTLRALPDLRADVGPWSLSGDVMFIDMTFRATIGGHPIAWRSVDRVKFANGVAIERVAYFDPTRLRRAFLRNPAALRQLLRLRFAG